MSRRVECCSSWFKTRTTRGEPARGTLVHLTCQAWDARAIPFIFSPSQTHRSSTSRCFAVAVLLRVRMRESEEERREVQKQEAFAQALELKGGFLASGFR